MIARVLGPDDGAGPRELRIRQMAAELDSFGGIEALRELERTMVRRKLHEADGNRTRAAEALGLSRKQVARRVAEAAEPSNADRAQGRGSGVFARSQRKSPPAAALEATVRRRGTRF